MRRLFCADLLTRAAQPPDQPAVDRTAQHIARTVEQMVRFVNQQRHVRQLHADRRQRLADPLRHAERQGHIGH